MHTHGNPPTILILYANTLIFPYSGATVILQTIADTTEGGMVMVCVDITGVPAEGSECDVVVSLSAQDGPKASKLITFIDICTT